jgi:single-stranded DNA-binding protein
LPTTQNGDWLRNFGAVCRNCVACRRFAQRRTPDRIDERTFWFDSKIFEEQ